MFLEEVVLARGNKKCKTGEGDAPVALSYSGVESYVKAVVDMYKRQKALGMTTIGHPRGQALEARLEGLRRGENERRRAQYHDRAAGTIQDGYNADEFKRASVWFLERNTGEDLRNRLDFLLGHFMLGRSESKRMLQLPDMFSLSLLNEGPQGCTAIVAIMTNGKTNQYGRIEYGSALRNTDALVCPVGALSLYFFWRWHVDGEPFPDFTLRKNWYNIFFPPTLWLRHC